MEGGMELTVRTISGEHVTSLFAEPTATVHALIRQLQRKAKRTAAVRYRKLVFRDIVLEDHRQLLDYGLMPGDMLQLIEIGPSGLAQSLEAMRHSPDPDECLAASLSDLADSVLEAQHVQSERRRPCVSTMEAALCSARRGQLICWMLRAFDVLGFDDRLLHSTVFTLDRFCAAVAQPIRDDELQKVVLAAACAEMKMADDKMPIGHWQRVLLHLCQGTCTLPTILRAEQSLLAEIEYVAGVPTALDFLNSFSMRLEHDYGAEYTQHWKGFAAVLLDTVLFDGHLYYQYPHLILAAAALLLALLSNDAPDSANEAILDDVSKYCPDLVGNSSSNSTALIMNCAEEMRWRMKHCIEGKGPFAAFFQHVLSKRKHGQLKESIENAKILLEERPLSGLDDLRPIIGDFCGEFSTSNERSRSPPRDSRKLVEPVPRCHASFALYPVQKIKTDSI